MTNASDTPQLVRLERRIAHPVERVWAALTEPEELEGWLARAQIDLVRGGAVELRWLNSDEDGNQAVARGTITELAPPRIFELATDIHGTLRWELEPDGDGTRLTFTCLHAPPAEYRAMTQAGWHIHLEHLADALDGRPIDWPNWQRDHMDRWAQLQERYQHDAG
jgi:uncharacterized protein YndB with AHSA1/START domain